jgi:predicted ATPase
MARVLCPALIGRERELATLFSALDHAIAGNGAVVVVSGPAGVGKSRLLTELATHAHRRIRGPDPPGAADADNRRLT